MERARQQAQRYARNLPAEELEEGGRPPFLIVVDVGESLTLYSEFTRTGGNYIPFPVLAPVQGYILELVPRKF